MRVPFERCSRIVRIQVLPLGCVQTKQWMMKILLKEHLDNIALGKKLYEPYEPFVKPGFTLYDSYKYRQYKWALGHLNYLTSKWKHIIHGFEPHPQLVDLFEVGGAIALSQLCDQLLDEYFELINEEDDDDEDEEWPRDKKCLECGDVIDTLKRCSRCKKVYFCDQLCQRRANMLHKFDCKKC